MLQIRASLFPLVVDALSACMAGRHSDPGSSLWRPAAAAFCAVVNAGLPAVNLAAVNHDQARQMVKVLCLSE